jgi:hypothetical protein
VITNDAYASVLERCLRLEAKIARIEITELPRRIVRATTADEIVQMRELRRRGFNYTEIGRRVARSAWTARHYTKDVLIEREGMGYDY